MSPSVDDFVKDTGKDFKAGDILVERIESMYDVETRYWEVVNPSAESPFTVVEQRKILGVTTLYQTKRTALMPSIELRELTPHGPVEKTVVGRKDVDLWTDIIRAENRSDLVQRERSR